MTEAFSVRGNKNAECMKRIEHKEVKGWNGGAGAWSLTIWTLLYFTFENINFI